VRDNGSWIALQAGHERAAPRSIRLPAAADIFNISITTGMVGPMMTNWADPAISRNPVVTGAGQVSGG
jgi:hypothetical protein